MNGIINFVIKNKFAVWIITFIVLAAGIYSSMTMKMEQMPSIKIPFLMVTTPYIGATPEQVEEKISIPVETAVQNLNGVELVTSTSYQGASSVEILYDYDTDLDKAEKEVNDALAKVDFPEGIETPKASTFDFDQIPILAYGIDSESMDLAELTKVVEGKVVPVLSGIEGVQNVDVTGQQLEEVQVTLDPAKMAQYDLTEESITQMVQASAIKFPLGVMPLDGEETSVVIDGKIATIDDLKAVKIPVVGAGGTPTLISLSDIATVERVSEPESISRTNGKEAIGLAITKSQSANTVDVANDVLDEVEKLEKDNKGLNFTLVLDQATPIEESISTMVNKAILGALFAVIIIWFFLRSFKTTLISVVSIPLSLLIAMFFLKQMDISLNLMTLGAMTVAIGRVIDDSIVVIENIFRRMSDSSEKLSGGDLIREATKEVFKPILSSTLVTIAVFLPLGLVGGMVGEVFMPFALAIVFALLASLFVSITIVPMLTHALFKKGLPSKLRHEEGRQHGKLALKYRSILNWSLNKKWIPLLGAFLLFISALALPATGLLGTGFANTDEQKMLYLTFRPNPASSPEDVDRKVKEAEEMFLAKDDVESVQSSSGGTNYFVPGDDKSAIMTVQYDKDTKDFGKEREKVTKELQKDRSIGKWIEATDTGVSNNITYYVYGDSTKDLPETVKQVEDVMKDNKDLKKVETSLQQSYNEYTLVVDQQKAAMYGLTAAQIGQALYPASSLETPVVTTVKDGDKELDVHVGVKEVPMTTIEEVKNTMIPTPLGVPVKVSDVATVEEGTTSDTIGRRDGKVYASVTATPTTDNVGGVSKDVKAEIDKIDTPDNVSIDQGGVAEDMQEAFTQLGLAMLAAIAIVYLILVITFGGAKAPFAILFTLPLTVIGSMYGLWISGEILEVTSMIGLLMLIGIVVTNAIVLVDRIIHKQQEGLEVREAILEAGATRLRPILMTAIATVGAMLPLALGFENSGLISRGLAVTVIGGLVSSTLLTLLIVPIIYELLTGKKKKKKKKAIEA